MTLRQQYTPAIPESIQVGAERKIDAEDPVFRVILIIGTLWRIPAPRVDFGSWSKRQ